MEQANRLEPDNATPHNDCVLLVFQLSNRLGAFRMQDVERITPMAELSAPPGLPFALEGFLNLGGMALPVLRLDRLFGLPAQQPGLYSMLVIPRSGEEDRMALLVDRVQEVQAVTKDEILAIGPKDTWNGCAEATVTVRGEPVHLLSPTRLLLVKEREKLSGFQRMAQQRLKAWKVVDA